MPKLGTRCTKERFGHAADLNVEPFTSSVLPQEDQGTSLKGEEAVQAQESQMGLCLALEHTIQLAMGPKMPSLQKKGHYVSYKADGILWPFLKEGDARLGVMKTKSGPEDHRVLRMG